MESAKVTIGEAAARFGLAASTLRYWEERGVLRPAERQSGRRVYGPEQLRRIALIQIWQDTGTMTLDEIAAVLAGRSDAGDWREAIQHRMTAVDEQIERLTTARSYLAHYLGCPRDHPADDCPKVRGEVERHMAALREDGRPAHRGGGRA